MRSDASTVEEYLAGLPEDRREAISVVRDVINAHLPQGYRESMGSGMISWGIPLEDYPHTHNGQPLGIVALASQRNHMSLYLMGLYTSEPEEQWFRDQYAQRGLKLDMGKSCLHFKTLDDLPLDVIGDAIASTPPDRMIAYFEQGRRKGTAARRSES